MRGKRVTRKKWRDAQIARACTVAIWIYITYMSEQLERFVRLRVNHCTNADYLSIYRTRKVCVIYVLLFSDKLMKIIWMIRFWQMSRMLQSVNSLISSKLEGVLLARNPDASNLYSTRT